MAITSAHCVVADAVEYAAGNIPEEVIIKGRGDTDFRPGVCLYLTDVKCSRHPETEPLFPVLWINHGDPPRAQRRDPSGQRIDIGAERT